MSKRTKNTRIDSMGGDIYLGAPKHGITFSAVKKYMDSLPLIINAPVDMTEEIEEEQRYVSCEDQAYLHFDSKRHTGGGARRFDCIDVCVYDRKEARLIWIWQPIVPANLDACCSCHGVFPGVSHSKERRTQPLARLYGLTYYMCCSCCNAINLRVMQFLKNSGILERVEGALAKAAPAVTSEPARPITEPTTNNPVAFDNVKSIAIEFAKYCLSLNQTRGTDVNGILSSGTGTDLLWNSFTGQNHQAPVSPSFTEGILTSGSLCTVPVNNNSLLDLDSYSLQNLLLDGNLDMNELDLPNDDPLDIHGHYSPPPPVPASFYVPSKPLPPPPMSVPILFAPPIPSVQAVAPTVPFAPSAQTLPPLNTGTFDMPSLFSSIVPPGSTEEVQEPAPKRQCLANDKELAEVSVSNTDNFEDFAEFADYE